MTSAAGATSKAELPQLVDSVPENQGLITAMLALRRTNTLGRLGGTMGSARSMASAGVMPRQARAPAHAQLFPCLNTNASPENFARPRRNPRSGR